MQSETPFRITLLAFLVLTMLVVGYRRWQAGKAGDRLDRSQEGIPLAIALRLAGIALWLAVFAYLINPDWMQWSSIPLPSWLRWLGAVLGAATIVLLYWTLSNLGKNLTDTVVIRAGATLVTSGPYRWVRHPFYVATWLLVLGVSLLAANWFIAICGFAVELLLVVRTAREEQRLLEKFGEAYRDYMARTGRFFPRVTQRRG